MDALLHRVQIEVGVRLNSLISESELLSPEQYARVARLRTLHALWLPAEQYELTFLSSSKSVKWNYQADQCKACIVSHLSGDLEVLLDLRCAIRSRATSRFVAKHGSPRLQVWIEAWIGRLAHQALRTTGQKVDVDAILSHNEEEAVVLKRLRAKIHHVRKTKYKYKDAGPMTAPSGYGTSLSATTSSNAFPYSTTTAQTEAGRDIRQGHPYAGRGGTLAEDLPEGGDYEGVDAYAALVSTPYLPMHAPNQGPTGSENPVSASASTKGKSPYRHSRKMPQGESVYSDDDMLNHAQNCSGHIQSGVYGDEEEEYIPARQYWTTEKDKKEESLLDYYFQPVSPRRCESPAAYNESWESVNFAGADEPVSDRRDPAESYLNLLDRFPVDDVESRHLTSSTTATGETVYIFNDIGGKFVHPSADLPRAAVTISSGSMSGRSPKGKHRYRAEASGMETVEIQTPFQEASSSTGHGGRHCYGRPTPEQGFRGVEAEEVGSETASSWGDLYESVMLRREDVAWFYKGR